MGKYVTIADKAARPPATVVCFFSLQNHNPVFIHGALRRRNVIIQGGGKIALIDWEAADGIQSTGNML